MTMAPSWRTKDNSSAQLIFRNFLTVQIIEATLIPADSFGTRTLRTPPEGDYYDHFAGRSRPNPRSGRLGHKICPEAASAPRRPYRSRRRVGGTKGPGERRR